MNGGMHDLTLRTRLVLAAALSLTTYFYLRTYYLSY